MKKFYTSLIIEKNLGIGTIKSVHRILHPTFEMAVRDNILRQNPTSNLIKEIANKAQKPKKRHSLTTEQQSVFVDFINASPKYRRYTSLITFALGTGCRIGECLGLQWEDCDFDNSVLTIRHNLIYHKGENDEKTTFKMHPVKTPTGENRIIPMLDEVKSALLTVKAEQAESGLKSSPIDGYSHFVFTNRYGQAYTPQAINKEYRRIRKAYNKAEENAANKENRNPVLLPAFSSHSLRHTFCTRFCENETNLKVIQEIMGHADITTTMNIYNEATKDVKTDSFKNLQGKIKIG